MLIGPIHPPDSSALRCEPLFCNNRSRLRLDTLIMEVPTSQLKFITVHQAQSTIESSVAALESVKEGKKIAQLAENVKRYGKKTLLTRLKLQLVGTKI